MRSPWPVRPAAAAGVEQAAVVRALAAEAVGLAQGQRAGCRGRASPGRARRPSPTVSSASIGVTPIQCCPAAGCCAVVRVVERVGVLRHGPPSTTWPRSARAASARGSAPRRSVAAVVLGARHVGEVVQAADQVDGVVELLVAHAGRSTLPRPSGQPSPSSSSCSHDVAQVAHREVVHLVAEAVVAGPAPDQRDGARELDRLVGVEVVLARRGSAGVSPCRTRSSRRRRPRAHDLAGAVVEDVRRRRAAPAGGP